MNFRSMIIAGLGSIGSSMINLGRKVLNRFDHVVVVDRDPLCTAPFASLGYTCKTGNIEDSVFLTKLLKRVPGPTLFVNLCSGVNNVRVRERVAEFDAAYLDSCASMTDDPDELRFSKLMPYTLTPIESRFPHWICWGINPGLVEIIARKLIRGFDDAEGCYDVTIYEYDQLYSSDRNSSTSVGWCPSALIEEVMLSPTLQIMDGNPVEEKNEGAEKTIAFWGGQPVESRVVAHEDIWNIGSIEPVQSAKFLYALHPDVMNILEGDPQEAVNSLNVPAPETPVFGRERVAVAATKMITNETHSLVWEVDHHKTWQRFGVNAVQFQTCKSLLLAVRLLQTSHYGTLPGTFCAVSLPIEEKDWVLMDWHMEDLGIHWHNADYLGLSTVQPLTGKMKAGTHLFTF